MSRIEVNRSGEMEVFVRVVDLGGFSAAARSFRMTPSAVSKLVARLESRLGVRLVNRSTRKLQLTPEGTAYYDRAMRILEDIDTAEREATTGATPRGRLRVNTSVPFGLHRLLPLLPGFMQRYPDVHVDVALTDTVVDLLEERADVAIRVGPLRESRLLARKLGESAMVVVAAPSYLARHGTPRSPQDLEHHNMLGFCFTKQIEGWPFRDSKGGHVSIHPAGNALVSDGEAMQRLVAAGLGLARLTRFHVQADIDAGRLVPVLESHNPGDLETVHAVFVGHGGQLPARVRAFLDYLVEHVEL
ncbi:LysR family transcriptional regulator [Bradyrhizobium sp. U87765 SZCCT0131]|uniref:LysR family transcriptional regulator n=1 Tax=unclassified Bradyrhizobium TaxID=2631580 RepID=UPI001BA65EE5|nr:MULTISPECIES: LysR family transcriptional regulator [unclassified Bradyrhizobium]MBR1218376.1 LysR family transcriptional regulator [Bradyrhizobium sp. U87765 SZCCT0131]MBR1260678.1 LysR family transcriptional regulator [Bradyrhizobium sp. U87765 SZCCT0134]MBR1303874.1 LysR family transcriptional regulator [Bradyrhizobium sp. U87765 SZCCT0110]MBR1319480.1 LysR family transcriptional regulator [Bradyrhizobium sp. U87765 SZCCT0109]MBR1347805.1 LysR family transcriptional regulator [Bradyrhizo